MRACSRDRSEALRPSIQPHGLAVVMTCPWSVRDCGSERTSGKMAKRAGRDDTRKVLSTDRGWSVTAAINQGERGLCPRRQTSVKHS